jgi:hypothetical protein
MNAERLRDEFLLRKSQSPYLTKALCGTALFCCISGVFFSRTLDRFAALAASSLSSQLARTFDRRQFLLGGGLAEKISKSLYTPQDSQQQQQQQNHGRSRAERDSL